MANSAIPHSTTSPPSTATDHGSPDGSSNSSGLVVVPKEHLAPVLAMTQAVAERELDWRQAIARGASMPAATGIDDLISELAAREPSGGARARGRPGPRRAARSRDRHTQQR
jgi:hypothetical protein